jgi:hypothetical protein
MLYNSSCSSGTEHTGVLRGLGLDIQRSKKLASCTFCQLRCQACPYQTPTFQCYCQLSSEARFRSRLQPSWSPLIFYLFYLVEEFFDNRYQSGSLSLINVGSDFHCMSGEPSLWEFLPQSSHPLLSMQDLKLDLIEQLCTLSLCRGAPRWVGWKSLPERGFPKAPLSCQQLTRGVCNNIGDV